MYRNSHLKEKLDHYIKTDKKSVTISEKFQVFLAAIAIIVVFFNVPEQSPDMMIKLPKKRQNQFEQ